MDEMYDLCKSFFEDLVEWYSTNKGTRNESTTRNHLINNLITSLGYEIKSNVTMEDSYEGVFNDYTIKQNGKSIMIIEAKKEGNHFILPEGNLKLVYKLQNFCKDNPEIEKALKQVAGYCQTRGVEVGVVTNGWQVIAFIANRTDGVPPLEGKAYLFPSLEFIRDNFLEFWNLLSEKGLEKRNLFNSLTNKKIANIPLKLSNSILKYPGIKDRNIFQSDMQILSDIVLEDLMKNRDLQKEFIEECYCKSGALSQYALISKNILKDRYHYLNDQPAPINITSVSDNKGLTNDFSNIIASSISKRPVLLIGSVGVGKSSFINNLIEVEAAEILQKALTFKIDLGSQAVISLNMQDSIITEIYNQFRDNYAIDLEENNMVRGIYHSELQRFRNGIFKSYFEKNDPRGVEKEIEFLALKLGNKIEHLKESFKHISSGRKKQIVIFIDNCDQRDYDEQQKAFLIAQEFAENWPVTVFLSLRPETFHRSIKEGALSGYHPKAFTISPPRIEEVIEKRLSFAQKIATGERDLGLANVSFAVNSEKLFELIEIMKYSFENNFELMQFIENISNGNVRRAIDLVKSFFGSGHIDTEKILEMNQQNIDAATGNLYLIPLHEFLRAVIYGDNIYYDPNTSMIANLFDVKTFDEKEHFIQPVLLSYLHSSLNLGSKDGFTSSIEIFKYFQSIGFINSQIENAISNLLDKKLIQTSDLEKEYRITSIGVYHVNYLLSFFAYFDAVVVDTPIFDNNFKNKITDINTIQDRLDRAYYFREYLDTIWSKYFTDNNFFNWLPHSQSLYNEISKINKVLS